MMIMKTNFPFVVLSIFIMGWGYPTEAWAMTNDDGSTTIQNWGEDCEFTCEADFSSDGCAVRWRGDFQGNGVTTMGTCFGFDWCASSKSYEECCTEKPPGCDYCREFCSNWLGLSS
eukprot:GFUD01043619.1.p1 GENE.GFUD01043619.1~~GFUD01043619.1.p1  ORF type:complete len:116 (-),score=3.53 GFUD01043619.1:329-676(-)